jgi:hypothetical protein
MHDEPMQRARLDRKRATKKLPRSAHASRGSRGPLCNNPTIARRDGLIMALLPSPLLFLVPVSVVPADRAMSPSASSGHLAPRADYGEQANSAAIAAGNASVLICRNDCPNLWVPRSGIRQHCLLESCSNSACIFRPTRDPTSIGDARSRLNNERRR